MTEKQKEVLRNIIYAVESGGQIYGNNIYDLFVEAYENTKEETAITIGAGQFFGVEAKELLLRIQKADPEQFKKLDTAGIDKDLKTADWNNYRVSKGSTKAKCIQKIISTDVGKKVQDDYLLEELEDHMKYTKEKLGVNNIYSQMMCANFIHQGGQNAATRIVERSKSLYKSTELDFIYKSCQQDKEPNQVGMYKSRQKFVYEHLKQLETEETSSEKEETVEDVKQGTPSADNTEQNTIKPSTKVRTAQKKMNLLFGCKFNIKEDGIWGTKSRAAFIKILQNALNDAYSEGLVVDGDYGPKTKAAVYRHILRKGTKNIYVRVLQIGLYAHEISLIGGIDGDYGISTYRGTLAFQKNVNLKDKDGIAGPETFNALITK